MWLWSDVNQYVVLHLVEWVYRFEFSSGPLSFAVRCFIFAPQWLIMRCLISLRGLVRQKIMVIRGLGPNPNPPNVCAAPLSLFTNGLGLAFLRLQIFTQWLLLQASYLILNRARACLGCVWLADQRCYVCCTYTRLESVLYKLHRRLVVERSCSHQAISLSCGMTGQCAGKEISLSWIRGIDYVPLCYRWDKTVEYFVQVLSIFCIAT